MRLDKWLWCARFFKTRGLAQQAIAGGRVHLDGARVKPGRLISAGARLEIQRGEECFEVTVAALIARRGPASEARGLYAESAASIERREAEAERRRLAAEPRCGERPTKRDRRRMIHAFREE
jgi:ribosome-associated heat shock protein Hsp15